jgi:DNA-binding CsgD family transcriptional regulator
VVPLASRDIGRLLGYGRAFEAPEIGSHVATVERLLDAVADLVPGEFAVISDSTSNHQTQAYATDDALADRRNSAVDLWLQCIDQREHPVITHHNETDDRTAAMTSDFLNRPALRMTTLYDHFWRPFAIDRTMGARIDTSHGGIYLASYRSSVDFSERDRAMLTGLATHARRLLHRSDVAALASDCRVRFALTAREAEILVWAIRGWTAPALASLLMLSPLTVKAHLHNVYRKTGWRTRAIAMIAVHGDSEASLRPEAGDAAAVGLTKRETDAVLGLTRGWTNTEIAVSMNVSLETAKSHLRHAYLKLGVTNRTEAADRYLAPST